MNRLNISGKTRWPMVLALIVPVAPMALVTLVLLFFSSCTFGVDISNTPRNAFETFVKLYRNSYAYQEEKGLSADDIHKDYWPRVRALGQSEEDWVKLFQVLVEIEDKLEDAHFTIYSEFNENKITRKFAGRVKYNKDGSYTPTKGYGKLASTAREEIPQEDLPVEILGKYEGYLYGTIKEDSKIGYILFRKLYGGVEGIYLPNNPWIRKIEFIVKDLKKRGVDRIILDARIPIGGSYANSQFIISHFIDKTRPYMISWDLTGSADNPANYKKDVISISPAKSGVRFVGPTVLLMNRITGSAAEGLVLAARQIENIKTIGNRTAGIPGVRTIFDIDVRDRIWFSITTSRTYGVNPETGKQEDSYLTVGLYPHILVKEDESTLDDEILEKGIEIIKTM